MNLSPPYEPEALSLGELGEVTLGRRRYVGSAAAEPDGPDTVVWEMSYRVEEDGHAIEQFLGPGLAPRHPPGPDCVEHGAVVVDAEHACATVRERQSQRQPHAAQTDHRD